MGVRDSGPPRDECNCQMRVGNGEYVGHEHARTCPMFPHGDVSADATWPKGWYTNCREGNHHTCPVGQIDGYDDCTCPCHAAAEAAYEQARKDAEETDYDHHLSGAECEGCNALWSHAYAMGKKDGEGTSVGFDIIDGPKVGPRVVRAEQVVERHADTHSRVLDQIVAAAKWVIQDMNHLVNHGGIGTHKPCLDALAEAVMAAAGSARLACIHSYWTEVDAQGNCVECGGYRVGRGPAGSAVTDEDRLAIAYGAERIAEKRRAMRDDNPSGDES